MNGTFARIFALTRKESRQLLRDKSNLAVGLLLPIVLILLFGYGLSLDLSQGRVAVVVEQHSPQANQMIAGLTATPYLKTTAYPTFIDAQQALAKNQTDAIVIFPPDFATRLNHGDAQVQLILNGASTNIAIAVQGYVKGALSAAIQVQSDRNHVINRQAVVNIEQRIWFNETANSRWFLVPGILALVLTLIGAFLTALLIAKEREQGTLEAIFVTPVRPIEIVIAKLVPYLVVGSIDLIICLFAAHYLFEVPIRGSLSAILFASFLYLIVSLSMGLMISGLASSQFLASQVALIISFMPALMLSGFVFDIQNLPAAIQVISQLLPSTHFMSLIKTLFLVGDNAALLLKECAILLLYALFFINTARLTLRKKLR